MKIDVREYNKQAYADIMKDMLKKKAGRFSFTILVNAGNVVEYTKTEVIDYKRDGHTNHRVSQDSGSRSG